VLGAGVVGELAVRVIVVDEDAEARRLANGGDLGERLEGPVDT